MKTYCLDTSVLLDNPKVIEMLGTAKIIVPFCVLGELDGKRHNEGHVGKNAREAIRYIDSIFKQGNPLEGIDLPTGSFIKVVHGNTTEPTNDLNIISCAKEEKAVILSNDIGLRVNASGLGIVSKSFEHTNQKAIYSGIEKVSLESDLLEDLYSEKKIALPNYIISQYQFYPNQMIILNANTLGRIKIKNKEIFIELVEKKNPWGVNPANAEQIFATELLLDPTVELVSLIGKAGCGKTFLAAAAGLEQSLEQHTLYEKIIILRPIVTVGDDIGFLPGTIEDKMAPWTQPIKDNLLVLFKGKQKNVDLQFESGNIIVEAMSYIRGRSIPKSFIIVDECQNISKDQLKTIITRAAAGSKIVLTGDIEQIDSKNLDLFSNGLSDVVDKFKNQSIAGHVTLNKGKRSKLASLAAEIL